MSNYRTQTWNHKKNKYFSCKFLPLYYIDDYSATIIVDTVPCFAWWFEIKIIFQIQWLRLTLFFSHLFWEKQFAERIFVMCAPQQPTCVGNASTNGTKSLFRELQAQWLWNFPCHAMNFVWFLICVVMKFENSKCSWTWVC
jgi:hypothetical protein